MPSNFVILSKKIKGYNNVLTTATEDMTFGVNKNVNYNKPQNNYSSGSRNTSHGNNSGNGDGAAFNERGASRGDNNNNTRTYNNTLTTALAGAQLPLTFFISLAVGMGVSAAFSVGISQLM